MRGGKEDFHGSTEMFIDLLCGPLSRATSPPRVKAKSIPGTLRGDGTIHERKLGNQISLDEQKANLLKPDWRSGNFSSLSPRIMFRPVTKLLTVSSAPKAQLYLNDALRAQN